MGVFDFVKLNHPTFGDDRGHDGQTKDFDDPWMEHYEISEDGRLLYTETTIEDRSDPNAPKGSFESIAGCMTAVPTGEKTAVPYHGYLWVWGKGDYKWKCKFTDGLFVSAEKVQM